MTVSSIASEMVFAAGWIAIGAAAAYSRYRKALERGETARGVRLEGVAREVHKGLFFGREALDADSAPPAARSAPDPAAELTPAGLASLARALEEAQAKVQPKEQEEKAPAP